MTPLPLARFAAFRTTDLDQAREEVAKIFCPHLLSAVRATPLNACHHTIDLGGFSLNYVQYGADVWIDPGRLERFFLLQIPLRGRAEIHAGRQEVAASAGQASLLSPTVPVRMRWSPDCGKLLLQISRAAVESTLQGLIGRRLAGPIEFDAALPLESGAGRRIADLARLLCDDVDAGDSLFLRAGAGPRMREMLITALLHAVPHNFSALMAEPPPGIAPRHVRQAEAFMRAHAADHLTVAEIAGAVGVSVRSLQESFRRFRDTTPLEALRGLRLDGARADLMRAVPGTSVTSVALDWGFAHLSRFAIAYAERFEERPSETVRRCRG